MQKVVEEKDKEVAVNGGMPAFIERWAVSNNAKRPIFGATCAV
jgi:hypothetical protein